MKKIALIAAILFLLSVMALSVYANHVAPHRHYIFTGSGQKVYVGPDFCDNENTGEGFDQFHFNVHRGDPTLKAFENPNNPVQLLSEGC